MNTVAKIEANRQNAQLSTGPRTLHGKAVASMNATKHGLMSRATLLPNESASEFSEFSESLRTALAPIGALQELLADHVVACAWRLRRLFAVEAAVLRCKLRDEETRRLLDDGVEQLPLDVRGLATAFIHRHDVFVNLSRYEAAIDRSMRKSLAELEREQARAGATIDATCDEAKQ